MTIRNKRGIFKQKWFTRGARVTRGWCRHCFSWTPHKVMWWIGSGTTCQFWNKDKGLCGCSTFDAADEWQYPETPCHGGHQAAKTCCRCKTARLIKEKGWVLDDRKNV